MIQLCGHLYRWLIKLPIPGQFLGCGRRLSKWTHYNGKTEKRGKGRGPGRRGDAETRGGETRRRGDAKIRHAATRGSDDSASNSRSSPRCLVSLLHQIACHAVSSFAHLHRLLSVSPRPRVPRLRVSPSPRHRVPHTRGAVLLRVPPSNF